MTRFVLTVAYKGTRYSGWQFQPKRLTVQGELEHALSTVANEPIKVFCAGRTDTGVHALGQVVHFDTNAAREAKVFFLGANALLPDDIRVTFSNTISEEFHARFSAVSRTYEYYIYQDQIVSPFVVNSMTHFPYELNVDAMHEAAQYLLGEQDFSSFRAAECQSNTPMRCVTEISVQRLNKKIIRMTISANAFLHHMVRNIVGVLFDVGQGKQSVEWVKLVLESQDRNRASVTAPPDGLYLKQVTYPKEFALPELDLLTPIF